MNPCRNPSERQPSISSTLKVILPHGRPTGSGHTAAQQGRTLLVTSRRTITELSLLSATPATSPGWGWGQSPVTKQGGAFFFRPNEGEEVHSAALTGSLQEGNNRGPLPTPGRGFGTQVSSGIHAMYALRYPRSSSRPPSTSNVYLILPSE